MEFDADRGDFKPAFPPHFSTVRVTERYRLPDLYSVRFSTKIFLPFAGELALSLGWKATVTSTWRQAKAKHQSTLARPLLLSLRLRFLGLVHCTTFLRSYASTEGRFRFH